MTEFIRNELLANLEARKIKLAELDNLVADYEIRRAALEEAEAKLAKYADIEAEKVKLADEILELDNYLFPVPVEEDEDEDETNALATTEELVAE